ncbi:MAG: DNA topoisomerase [archaeon]
MVVHNSTRHEILQKLLSRKYISGIKSIEPNQIAFAVIDSLEKHCNIVTDPKMTSELEIEMDEVANGKNTKQKVVGSSRTMLHTVLDQLLQNKLSISFELKKALTTQDVMGICPNDQGNLVLRKAGATGKRFLGCANFPTCRTTFPLPQKGSLSPTNKTCSICQKAPIVKLSGSKFKMEICVNMDCPSKDAWKKEQADKAARLAANPPPTPVSPPSLSSKPKPTKTPKPIPKV